MISVGGTQVVLHEQALADLWVFSTVSHIYWVCWGPGPAHGGVVYSSDHKTKSQFPSCSNDAFKMKHLENRHSNDSFLRQRSTLASNIVCHFILWKYFKSLLSSEPRKP